MKSPIFVILSLWLSVFAVSAQQAATATFATNTVSDIALCYKGSPKHIEWTEQEIEPYVVHTFASGKRDWLFNGFLFLEFNDGMGNLFATNWGKNGADKKKWQWLLNRNFEQGKAVCALNSCIGKQKKLLGTPPFTHAVIMALPVPFPGKTNWGKLGGKKMNFNKQKDQIYAMKWYVDQVMQRFSQAKLGNLRLEGFYWIDENIQASAAITKAISSYIHSKGMRFYWIPYFSSRGLENWKSYGFDFAYLQPNYFFNKQVPRSRLNEACRRAASLHMGMEFEVDERVLHGRTDSFAPKMTDYIDDFTTNGVFSKSAVAYYLGTDVLVRISRSTDAADHALFDRLAGIITSRRRIKW